MKLPLIYIRGCVDASRGEIPFGVARAFFRHGADQTEHDTAENQQMLVFRLSVASLIGL